MQLVGEADNGREVLALTAQERPDVIFMDIQMPVMDGIETTKRLKETYPDVGIIALTMFNDDNLVVDMLEAGAKGYLLKNTNAKEVAQAIQAVYNGGTYYCSATSQKLTKLIASSKYNPYKRLPKPTFTEREIQVMKLICQEYSNKEIANVLNISSRTVETHREKILEKTDAKNAVGIALYAIKEGFYSP